MYSPPGIAVPPRSWLICLILSTGPAIRLVPVSAIAWRAPLTIDVLPTITLQYMFNVFSSKKVV